MRTKIILSILALSMLAGVLSAAPGGVTHLTDKKFDGFFHRMPEWGLDEPRGSDEIRDCRKFYDEDQQGLQRKHLATNLGYFPVVQCWNSPGAEVSIGRDELLAYFSPSLQTYGVKPMSEDVAESVLETELLYMVGWNGPHTEDYIEQIVDNRDVRYVFLAGSPKYPLTGESIKALRGGRKLAGLALSGEGVKDPEVVEEFCDVLKKNRKTLRYLYIEYLSPVLLPYLSDLKSLETLQVVHFGGGVWNEAQGKEWKQFLSAQEDLTHVYLSAHQIKDDWLSPLAGADDLEVLHISADVTGSFLRDLKTDKLVELDIHSRRLEDLTSVTKFEKLERVRIFCCEQGYETLLPLTEVSNLLVLMLENCTGADDAFVEAMNFHKLRALEISGKATLTEKGLRAIADFETLKSLDLALQPITDDILAGYADELEELAALNLYRAGEPTDAGLEPWLEHRQIREFNVNRDSISRDAMSNLWKHLRENEQDWQNRNKDKFGTFKVGR